MKLKKLGSCFIKHKNYKLYIAIKNLHHYNTISQKNMNPALHRKVLLDRPVFWDATALEIHVKKNPAGDCYMRYFYV